MINWKQEISRCITLWYEYRFWKSFNEASYSIWRQIRCFRTSRYWNNNGITEFSILQCQLNSFCHLVKWGTLWDIIKYQLNIEIYTLSIVAWRFSPGIKSILFRTTTIRLHVISPITRHSAVCVCIPFVISITNIIMSIIWAPKSVDKISMY